MSNEATTGDVITYEDLIDSIKKCREIMQAPKQLAVFHPDMKHPDFNMTLGDAKKRGLLPDSVILNKCIPKGEGYKVDADALNLPLPKKEPTRFMYQMRYGYSGLL